MAKGGVETSLRLVFNSYLVEQGQPVDGSGQMGPDTLQRALQVRGAGQGGRGRPGASRSAQVVACAPTQYSNASGMGM